MSITVQELNKTIGSLESAYYALVLEGYYMPKLNSQCVDSNSPFGVMTNKVFRIKLEHVKVGQLLAQATKYSLWEELKVLQQNFEKPFGFSEESLPDKPWLVNILFTYAPDHKFFRKYINKEDLAPFTQEEIKLIKQFDFSQGKKKSRFFKRSRELLKDYQEAQQKQKQQNSNYY